MIKTMLINYTDRLEVNEKLLNLIGETLKSNFYKSKDNVLKAHTYMPVERQYLKIDYAEKTGMLKEVLVYVDESTEVLRIVTEDTLEKVMNILSDFEVCFEQRVKFDLNSSNKMIMDFNNIDEFKIVKLENEDFCGVAFNVSDTFLFPVNKISPNKYECAIYDIEELEQYNLETESTCNVSVGDGEELLPMFMSSPFEIETKKGKSTKINFVDEVKNIPREDIVSVYKSPSFLSDYDYWIELEDVVISIKLISVFDSVNRIYTYKLVDEIEEDIKTSHNEIYKRKEFKRSSLARNTTNSFSFLKY